MNRRSFIAFLIAAPITSSLPWKTIAVAIQPIAPTAATAINEGLAVIIARTIREQRHRIAANIIANNDLLRRLKSK